MSLPAGRIWAGEGVGTAFLVMAVVGSGIMAERLAGGHAAVALLANSLATGAALLALILACGPVSGAHFNPLVSLAEAIGGRLSWRTAALYVVAQFSGAVSAIFVTHAMFGERLFQLSGHARSGPGQWLGETVATFGLLCVINSCAGRKGNAVALAVAAYIAAAYWFTSSTSFANPAVTVARALTDSFTGIRLQDVPGFVLAQTAGAALAVASDRWLRRSGNPPSGGGPAVRN